MPISRTQRLIAENSTFGKFWPRDAFRGYRSIAEMAEIGLEFAHLMGGPLDGLLWQQAWTVLAMEANGHN